MIGVAISTCNRRDMLLDTISHWRKHLPEDARLIIVDDASDTPVPGMDGVTVIHHTYRRGVAATKNRCIAALLDLGCTDLFLADDDCYPVVDDWWEPYINSPEHHLSWQWTTRKPWTTTFDDGTHWACGFPRGVMLYVTQQVIDTVGGMDTAYGVHGGEHVEWQQRIHDNGFGTHPFMDVCGSDKLWWSLDREQGGTLGSTIPLEARRTLIEANGRIWDKPRPTFVSFREHTGVQDWQLGPDLFAGHHYSLLEHTATICPQGGVAVEFGVGRGESTRILADRMPVVGFDSGEGIPDDWRPEFPRGSFAFGIPDVPGAKIVEGWYDQTLPAFDFAALGHIGLVHIDCDVYSSTRTVLDHVGPYLKPGTFIVFDEMWGYPGHEEHELKAFREWADETGRGWTVVGHSLEAWSIRLV